MKNKEKQQKQSKTHKTKKNKENKKNKNVVVIKNCLLAGGVRVNSPGSINSLGS